MRSSQAPTRGRRAAAQPTSPTYGFPSAVPAPTRQGGSRGSSASQRRRPWDRPRCESRDPSPRLATTPRSTGAAARDDRPARVGAAGAAHADVGWRGAAFPVAGTQHARAYWIATLCAGHAVMCAKGGGLPFRAAEGHRGGKDGAHGSGLGATRLAAAEVVLRATLTVAHRHIRGAALRLFGGIGAGGARFSRWAAEPVGPLAARHASGFTADGRIATAAGVADLVSLATLAAARSLRLAAFWWRAVIAANARRARPAASGFDGIGARDGEVCIAAHRLLPVLAGMADFVVEAALRLPTGRVFAAGGAVVATRGRGPPRATAGLRRLTALLPSAVTHDALGRTAGSVAA